MLTRKGEREEFSRGLRWRKKSRRNSHKSDAKGIGFGRIIKKRGPSITAAQRSEPLAPKPLMSVMPRSSTNSRHRPVSRFRTLDFAGGELARGNFVSFFVFQDCRCCRFRPESLVHPFNANTSKDRLSYTAQKNLSARELFAFLLGRKKLLRSWSRGTADITTCFCIHFALRWGIGLRWGLKRGSAMMLSREERERARACKCF